MNLLSGLNRRLCQVEDRVDGQFIFDFESEVIAAGVVHHCF